MKVAAAPIHRLLAGMLVVTAISCIGYGHYLYPQDYFVMAVSAIVLVPGLVIPYVPIYFDHAGVTYEVNEQSIVLWRKGKVRKLYPMTQVTGVECRRNFVIIYRRGLFHPAVYLHPQTSREQFAETIVQAMRRLSADTTPAATTPKSERSHGT